MLVDEGDHGLNRRSSSAWAKYADALRRISFAWRSSRFSRSSALMPLALVRRQTRPHALVTLGLPHPVAQRLAPSSRSSRQSSGSPPTARRARLGGPAPSEPRGHGPRGNTGELASSWLHPLKSWSLRETRGGSLRETRCGSRFTAPAPPLEPTQAEFSHGLLELANRLSKLAISPAGTECFDIFSPPPRR